MLSDRPYRRGESVAIAVAEIVRCSGTQFDPEVVQAFSRLSSQSLEAVRKAFPDAPRAVAAA